MLKIAILFILVISYANAEIAPRVTLNDGTKIPIVGLGTWQSGPEVYQAVLDAIEIGYRHLDTSLNYGTEPDIGNAIKLLIKEKKITREELYIVSKLETDGHSRSMVLKAINESLTNLDMSYLDLYLIHFPVNDRTIVDTWKGMEDVQRMGLTKSIGVSNFNEKEVELVLQNANIKPVTNQVYSNPYRNEKKLLSYLKSKNITMTAFSPLASGDEISQLTAEPIIATIAKSHNVSAAQVVLRYQIERNVIIIPKTVTKKYLIEDINLFNFKLTDQEMAAIETLS